MDSASGRSRDASAGGRWRDRDRWVRGATWALLGMAVLGLVVLAVVGSGSAVGATGDGPPAGIDATELGREQRRATGAVESLAEDQSSDGAAESAVDNARSVVDSGVSKFAISGRVLRRGVPVPHRSVRVRGPKGTAFVESDEHGNFRTEAVPGTYGLDARLAGRIDEVYSRGPTPVYGLSPGEQLRQIEVVDSDVQADVLLEPGLIQFVLRDVKRVPRAGVLVFALPYHGKRDKAPHATTDSAGAGVLDELPHGTWTFDIDLPFHRLVGQRSVWLREGGPPGAIDLTIEPTGTVEVKLVTDNGGLLSPALAPAVVLVQVDGDEKFEPIEVDAKLRGGQRALVFERVPAGKYEAQCAFDPAPESGPVRYESVEAPKATEVEVVAGERCEVRIPAHRRARVRIRGAVESGRLDLFAALVVRRVSDDREVAPGPWHTRRVHNGLHFDGYLEPGRYALDFSWEDGRAWRHLIKVEGNEPQRLTVDLPR